MKKRELLVVQTIGGYIVAGRCSICHRPFDSHLLNPENASNDIVMKFDDHTCNEDANQAAARIVREATHPD